MGICKTKNIQIDLGIIRHNQAYPGIIQASSEPYVTLAYLELRYIQKPDIFRTGSISEPWHIHNAGIFRTSVFSEHCYIKNLSNIQNPAKHLR